jgi:hypothetical protein
MHGMYVVLHNLPKQTEKWLCCVDVRCTCDKVMVCVCNIDVCVCVCKVCMCVNERCMCVWSNVCMV